MSDAPNRSSLRNRIDPFQIIIVVIVLLLAVLLWSETRQRVVRPLDDLVTERLCITYGEEIEREVTGFERSNRFGLVDRSEGYCQYGDGPNGEAPMTVTIEQTLPGPLYRAAKIIGIIVQLGIVSIFLRFALDPVLEFYRYVRARLT